MSDPSLPIGARTNGLSANAWFLITSTSSPIADNLLLALRDSGIAAFSLPKVETENTQQIFVDRSKRPLATSVIIAEHAELEVPTEFDEIIGQFLVSPTTNYLDELDRRDHFVPELPEPLPQLERGTRIALVGVIGGPLLLAFITITEIDPTGFGTWLSVGGFLAGFVALLFRTKNEPEQESPDDGAVL